MCTKPGGLAYSTFAMARLARPGPAVFRVSVSGGQSWPCKWRARAVAWPTKLEHTVFVVVGRVDAGGDMDTLKDYVVGKMLWNTTRNPDDLITQFLNGYVRTCLRVV